MASNSVVDMSDGPTVTSGARSVKRHCSWRLVGMRAVDSMAMPCSRSAVVTPGPGGHNGGGDWRTAAQRNEYSA